MKLFKLKPDEILWRKIISQMNKSLIYVPTTEIDFKSKNGTLPKDDTFEPPISVPEDYP